MDDHFQKGRVRVSARADRAGAVQLVSCQKGKSLENTIATNHRHKKMDDNNNMTGISVGHDGGIGDAQMDDNVSTVGDSSVVANTWNQKVKLLDDKCLFGESEKRTEQLIVKMKQLTDYFSNVVQA